MKTPKRYQNKPLPMLPEDNVVDDWVIEVWCARAKRKNREKQLKRTINKLSYERDIFKARFIQNREFLKRLVNMAKKPNRSTLHRLTDIYQAVTIELAAMKDYRKEEK